VAKKNKLTQMNKWRAQLAAAGVEVDRSWKYETLQRKVRSLKKSGARKSSCKKGSSVACKASALDQAMDFLGTCAAGQQSLL